MRENIVAETKTRPFTPSAPLIDGLAWCRKPPVTATSVVPKTQSICRSDEFGRFQLYTTYLCWNYVYNDDYIARDHQLLSYGKQSSGIVSHNNIRYDVPAIIIASSLNSFQAI